MTILPIVLLVVVLAALVLAVELLRPEVVTEEGLADLNKSLLKGRDYGPMIRLFEDRDYQTVERLRGGSKRLSRERGRVMRLYLKELRADFLQAWAVCRLLAPLSQEADPVRKLLRQWLNFHVLLGAVWVRTYAGQHVDAADGVRGLVTAFSDLRQGAVQLLQQDTEWASASADA